LIVCRHIFFSGWSPYYWNDLGVFVALGLTSIAFTGAQMISIHATLAVLRAAGMRVVRVSRDVGRAS
jgi:hypothetical protein